MTKEEVYDKEINPLMAQIIDICKREKIAVLANFCIPSADDPGLRCTTALLGEEYGPSKEQLAALSLLRDGFAAFMVRPKL